MLGTLAAAIAVGSLVLAGWFLVTVIRGGATTGRQLAGVAAVEVLLLVQAAVAVAKLAGGEQPMSTVTFVGYLVSALLVLPAGYFLSLLERTRWGAAVAALAAATLPVLVLRLNQVWHG